MPGSTVTSPGSGSPAAPSTTISDAEYDRMVASVSAPRRTNKEARRLELKQKSEQRTAKWPNTLEAMRQKKDRWKKDKEEREEEARKRIDEEELRLQREAQSRQIEKANKTIFEQTDRMKTLRSKQLLADVLHHRMLQLQDQKLEKEQLKHLDEEYDKMVLAKVLEGELQEQKEQEKKQQAAERLAVIQKQQLEEYKQRYITELREEKREGERIRLKAEQDLRDEQERELAWKRRMKQASAETQLDNVRLKQLRLAEKERERQQDAKRDEDEKKKQERNAKREEIASLKRQQAQARKQKMIDLATKHLVDLENKNEARLENQFKEVRAKEDKELADRANRRAQEKIAIDQSRQRQLEAKRLQHEKDVAKAKQSVRQWNEYGKKLEAQMKQEEEEVRLNKLKLAIEQKTQADTRRQTLMEQRAQELFATEGGPQDMIAREDAMFHQIATEALEKAKQEGLVNLYPIKKALAESRIDLLPASGFRV